MWIPGVSTKMIWAVGVVRTPSSAVRVVCGLELTIASFSPTKAFKSVDLPALGSPMMDAVPARNAKRLGIQFFFKLLFHAGDTDAVYTSVVGGQYFQSDAVAFSTFAHARDAAEPFGDETADGGGFELFVGAVLEKAIEMVDVEGAGDDPGAFAVGGEVLSGFVFIADFAEDFFDEIFHGGEAGGVAVLIDYDGDVSAVVLHFAQQVSRLLYW